MKYDVVYTKFKKPWGFYCVACGKRVQGGVVEGYHDVFFPEGIDNDSRRAKVCSEECVRDIVEKVEEYIENA